MTQIIIQGILGPPGPDNSGIQPISNKYGPYVLTTSDVGSLITFDASEDLSLNLPQDSDLTFAVGKSFDVLNLSATYYVALTAGLGATVITSALTTKTKTQNSKITAQKIAVDTWLVTGDLAAS